MFSENNIVNSHTVGTKEGFDMNQMPAVGYP